MYVVDASVWVNSFDQKEVGHEISRRFLTLLAEQQIAVAVPTLVLAEVAAAISRSRQEPAKAHAFAEAISRLPNLAFKSLDMVLARQSFRLAAQHGLRGADAVYAAVALETGYTLVSLDKEHLTRLQDVVIVKKPADVLAPSASTLGPEK
jgi:predicted nucleic acid-binding protein